jgi:hypothetical protein
VEVDACRVILRSGYGQAGPPAQGGPKHVEVS